MDQELSSRAERLLVALRERSEGRRRLGIDVVSAAFEAAFPHLRGRPEARSEQLDLLTELRERSLIRLPTSERSWDRHQSPPLPRWVQWPSPPRKARAAELAREVPWHPALAFLTRLQGLRHSELRDARQIQTWLAAGTGRQASLALRERSLEIFGDDKHLELLLGGRFFAAGGIDLSILRCHVVHVPLLTMDVGIGDVLLVIENKDTFDSAVRAVRALGNRSSVRWVAFGHGDVVLHSIFSVCEWPIRPSSIWYFGDVDLRGVEILTLLLRSSASLGIHVAPHDQLYCALLTAARERAIELTGDARCSAARAHDLASWFSGELREGVEAVLRRGGRYPQELVAGALLQEILDGGGPAVESVGPATRERQE